MPLYMYDLRGVDTALEFSSNGGQLVWNGSQFEVTIDGSIPSQLRIPTTPIDPNDAASKAYVDLSVGGSGPYDIVTYTLDTPLSSEVVITMIFTRTVIFQDNWTGSMGTVEVNPTAVFAIDVQRNAISIGSISVSTGGIFTFNTLAAATETFNTGDILTLRSSAIVDATIAGIAITLSGVF